MNKFLNKWFREFHRWMAVPTALAIPIAVGIKFFGDPEMAALWEKLDKIPSLLMLVMAIGQRHLYFFLSCLTLQSSSASRGPRPLGRSGADL